MFTGIIECLGKISRFKHTGKMLHLVIDAGAAAKSSKEGDSIAVNGVCLTITKKEGSQLHFDAVAETLKRSSLGALRTGADVNLERAIKAGEPFGGHFVQGHVDAVGKLVAKDKKGGSWLMTFSAPRNFGRFLLEKGSVAIDGISLTITAIRPGSFSVSIIPHTLKHTTLGKKTVGDTVNLEGDMLGKWVTQAVDARRKGSYGDEGF
ncbi:MAG: riboflavin synthase [Candidatus Brocadiia bacterium]